MERNSLSSTSVSGVAKAEKRPGLWRCRPEVRRAGPGGFQLTCDHVDIPSQWLMKTKLSPSTNNSVPGSAHGEHHQAAKQQTSVAPSQGPSQQSRHGARLKRVHVDPCCWLWPVGLNSRTQTQDAARAQVSSRKTGHVFQAFTMVTTAKHAAGERLAGLRPDPPARGRARCGRRPRRGPVGLL